MLFEEIGGSEGDRRATIASGKQMETRGARRREMGARLREGKVCCGVKVREVEK